MSEVKADHSDFQKKINDLINSGCTAISMAMAVETGMFDVIMAAERPLTSTEIAERGQQKERYVRELLGCLTLSGVVNMEPCGETYYVPQSRHTVLEKTLHRFRYLIAASRRFEAIKSCFSSAGPAGLERSAYGGVLDVVNKDSELGCHDVIDKDFLAKVPELHKNLQSGIEVGEFGCGTGVVLLELAKRFPASRFCGSDIDSVAINQAQQRTMDMGLTNIDFEIVDFCNLPDRMSCRFDWTFVCSVIHDVPRPKAAVAGLLKSMKDGGLCTVIDINARSRHADNIGAPNLAFESTMSVFFCVPECLNQDASSEALGALWGMERGKELFTSSGFKLLHCGECAYDSVCCLYILQK